MDYLMKLPLKVSSATSNFMIGVTAGAGALVFLSRGDIAASVAAPVALGVTAGALWGGRVLPRLNVGRAQKSLRDYPGVDCNRDGLARVSQPLTSIGPESLNGDSSYGDR